MGVRELVGLIALITASEYLGLADAYGTKPARILTFLFTLILFGSVAAAFMVEMAVSKLPSSTLLRGVFPKEHPLLFFAFGATFLARDGVLLAGFVFLVAMMRRATCARPGGAATRPWGWLTSACRLCCSSRRARVAGAFFIFYLLVVVWSGDILAFTWADRSASTSWRPDQPQKELGGNRGFPRRRYRVGNHHPGACERPSWASTQFESAGSEAGLHFDRRSVSADAPIWVYVLVSAAMNVAAQLGTWWSRCSSAARG